MEGKVFLMMADCIGSQTKYALVEYFGSSKAVLLASEKELREAGVLRKERLPAFLEERNRFCFEKEERFLREKNYHFVTMEEDDYPSKLRQIENPPYGIFYRGKLPPEETFSVAIVGARMCSRYGQKMAEELAEMLALNGICILSGLAAGIDSYAMKAALSAGGESFGVLGNGIDICYPSNNLPLFMEVEKRGGLLSEVPPKAPPRAFHFPLRNRLISGLSDVVIVVEAKGKSGSLITADYAMNQGKDVFAVPGRIGDSLSGGCNYLIKQGAGMILSPQDLMEELQLFPKLSEKKKEKMKFPLEKEEMLVYSCVDLFPKSVEILCKETGLSCQVLQQILVRLQLSGYIEEAGKASFIRR